MEHDTHAVIPVGPGIGEHVDGQRGEYPVAVGGGSDIHPHRVAARRNGELVAASELVDHRRTRHAYRQQHQVLGEHLLFSTETAAHPWSEYPDLFARKAKHMAELITHQERHLAAGTQHVAAPLVLPTHRAVRLQMHMLYPRRLPAAGDHRPRFPGPRQRRRDIAHLAVHLGHQIAGGIGDTGAEPLVAVHQMRSGQLRCLWIEYRWQHFIFDVDVLQRPVRDGRRICHYRRDSLSREPQHPVKNQRVVRVVGALMVAGGRERDPGVVPVAEHRTYSGQEASLVGVDPRDAGRRVRAAQHRNISHTGGQLIHRVRLGTGDHPRGGRGADAPPR
ncbi:Uncharacterised protein [Mycobacteroides abscessus subsp. abscessus]|nr:Uncharacterised protein [Mycobacteroides abscessus subsp. abscessus]